MSDIVDLPHLVPVHYQPRRGRTPKLGLDRVVTPVRLVEASPSEFGEVLNLGRYAVREHDGRLWSRLTGGGTEGLLGFLGLHGNRVRQADEEDFSKGSVLQLITRSPLVPAVPVRPVAAGLMPSPGTPIRILSDRREAAVADLARYVEEDVRIVGDDVMVRLRGPLLVAYGGSTGKSFSYSADTWAMGSPCVSTMAPRAQVAWDLRRLHGVEGSGRDGEPLVLHGADPESMGGGEVPPIRDTYDDVLHFLNAGAPSLLATVQDCFGIRPGAPLAGLVDVLAPLADRGMFGGIGLGEAAVVAETLGGAARAVLRHWEENGVYPASAVVQIASHVDVYVLPALSTAPSPEDEAALGALGGGW